MYSGVLGASTTTTAAIVLPNTNGNTALSIVAWSSLVLGVIVTLSSIARIVAKRAAKVS